MADLLSVLWTIINFILGIAWSLVWFILRDLLSTLLWIGIAIWIGFALRYRSFAAGSVAMLRYGRHGAMYLWRWVRGLPSGGLMPPPPVTKIVKEYRTHVPLGYVQASGLLNVLLVGLMILIAHV